MDGNGQVDESFEALLRFMRDSRGFDFTGYKRTSLMRRVRHRMEQAGHPTFEEYLDTLQASSDEFAALFNTILINVTTFFRDPDAWDYLRTDAIPAMLAARAPHDPIRIWSAGCASGQEPYSLAMLLAEALGPDDYRQRVKIYATDVDEDALSRGAGGVLRRQGASRRCRRSISQQVLRPRQRPLRASARTFGAPSSSVATTWSRTRRSPASTCWHAATR